MSSSTATPSAAAPFLEPSPASTYGGSVASDAGGDVPPTPIDGADSLLAKLNKLTIEIKDKKSSVALYSPPFIRNGTHDGDSMEDPFTSPPGRASGQRTPTGPKKSKAAASINWRSGSSASSGSGSASPSAGRGSGHRHQGFTNTSLTATLQGAAFQPADAQAIYPPSSCAFVANLLQSESDEALEVAVTRAFREFGTVFVKIRRDTRHMPFAFCQYTNDLAAENAIRLGPGRMICGRPCRVEKAKAHRVFYFERKYGSAISREEAGELLRVYGRLDCIKAPSHLERSAFNLSDGIIVQFQMYDEGQAALQAFRNHDVYKMQSMSNMTSSRGTPARLSDPANRLYLETYELDRRSIFVGGLPTDIEVAELEDRFKSFGQVVRVTIHKPESVIDTSQKHCFAFIEFVNYHMANRAIDEMNNAVLRGKILKVSQKDTEAAKSRNNVRRQIMRASPMTSAGPLTVSYTSPPAAGTPASEQASSSAYPSPGSAPYNPFYQAQWGLYGGQFYPAAPDYSGYYAAGGQPFPGPYAGTYPGNNHAGAYSPTPNYQSGASMTAAGSPTHPGYAHYPTPGYTGYQGYQGYQGYPGYPGYPGHPGYPGYHAAPVYYNASAYHPAPAYTEPAVADSTSEEVHSTTPILVGQSDETSLDSE